MTHNSNRLTTVLKRTQPQAGESNVYTDGFGRNQAERLLTDGGEDEWRPSCYDCGREFASASALVSHPVHIHHDDGGYDRVEVPMCPSCRKKRMHTYECEICGQEWLDITDATECCQHRQQTPVPDGGEVTETRERLDTDALPEPVCEHCGGPIDDSASECPALEEGWCHP